MDDNLHNDNLEDFFRKSLQNFEDNPDDFVWDDIAAFIQPVVNPEMSQLQKKVQQLNNQNLFLKVLLTTIGLSIIYLLPFNPQNQQQKITLLGQKLIQQNKTITALNQKIDSLYAYNTVNPYINQEEKITQYPLATFKKSNIPPSVNSTFKQEAKPLHHNTTTYSHFDISSSITYHNNQEKTFQDHTISPFKNKHILSSINPKEKPLHRTVYVSNPSQPPILPYINTEHTNTITNSLKKKNMSQWEKDLSEKNKRIRLPSFHLKPILEKLDATIYVGMGQVENHFRYDDSFLGEGFSNINGVFQEDSEHLQYGLLLACDLNEHLQIQSGIGESQYQQDIKNIQLEGIYTALNPSKELELNDQFYTSYSSNEIEYTLNNIKQQFPDAQILDTLRVPIEVRQNINYLSIPLAAKYNFGKKRLRFFIKGGLEFNFLINNKLEISSPHPSFQKHKLLQSSGLQEIHLSYQLETGLQYQLSKYIDLQIAPYYRASILQLTEDLPVIAYPATTGLRIGANFQF